jgi:hypothetical protein
MKIRMLEFDLLTAAIYFYRCISCKHCICASSEFLVCAGTGSGRYTETTTRIVSLNRLTRVLSGLKYEGS